MTEIDLARIAEANRNKKIKINLLDKSVIIGKVYGFTQAIDNEPEIAEIDIWLDSETLSGAMLDEIESIEVLE